jgi:hypothetical protein
LKSNICAIKKGGIGLETILTEVEKVTNYNGLQKKESLRLRLLAEELTGMLPELVENFDGFFWVENDGNKYELHTEFFVDSLSVEEKQALIAVSANKKNAAATGFMGKIREIAESMLLHSDSPDPCYYAADGYACDYDIAGSFYSHMWTLEQYLSQQREKGADNGEEWDQLEKSIVAKLANDVIVGVRGSKVEIVIKKEF